MAWEAPAGAGFAYRVAVRTLDDQLRRIEALDTKAGVLIAAGGVILRLLAGDRSSLVEAPMWIGVTVLGTVPVRSFSRCSRSPLAGTRPPRAPMLRSG